jgi:hypothetical protein
MQRKFHQQYKLSGKNQLSQRLKIDTIPTENLEKNRFVTKCYIVLVDNFLIGRNMNTNE